MRHHRSPRKFSSLVAACAIVSAGVALSPWPNVVANAAYVTLTNGDCTAAVDEGTGGRANGGIVLQDMGADCMLTFGSSRLTGTDWKKPLGVATVDVLVVGGGGDGGWAYDGGGGGGGGGEVIYQTGLSVPNAETVIEIYSGYANNTQAVRRSRFTVTGGTAIVAQGGYDGGYASGETVTTQSLEPVAAAVRVTTRGQVLREQR